MHFSTIMRLRLWFVLILAFFVGMGCAVALRTFYFEVDPGMVRRIPESTAKILIATQTIPSGIEITADFVAFQDVPLSEVPLGALTSFAQVYRRQAAYPIPEGCPICEDLLLASVDAASQAGFVPTGSQRVTLGIVHVRQGDKVFPPQRQSLSSILTADQSIDVRVVPRNEARGRLAAMKNEVLRTFAAKDSRNVGELILENATIYEIDSAKDSLTLLLAQNEAAKLTAAAKKGHLQIFTRHDKRNAPEAVEVEGTVESMEQSQSLSPSVPVALPFEQPLSQNMPHAQELPLSIPMEPAPIVALEKVQKVAPMPVDIVVDTTLSSTTPVLELTQSPVARSPQSLDRFDRQPEEQPIVALPVVENDALDLQSSQNFVIPAKTGIQTEEFNTVSLDSRPEPAHDLIRGGSDGKKDFAVLLENNEETLIRNDAPMVSFSMLPLNEFPVISLERPMEQAPMSMRSKTASADEPEPVSPTAPYLETIVAQPRVSQAIQFLPPGTVLSTRREYSPEVAKRTDAEKKRPMPTPFPAMTPEMPATPSVIPVPQILSEKAGVAGYSPFERPFEKRVFTIHQDGEVNGGSPSSGVLPAPPLLLKVLGTGSQSE